jgi:hypothetical protein
MMNIEAKKVGEMVSREVGKVVLFWVDGRLRRYKVQNCRTSS